MLLCLICVVRDERAKLHVTVLKERIFAERLGYQVYKEIAVVQGSVNPLPRLFSMAQKKEIDALLMDTPESLAKLRDGDLSAALRTAYEFSRLGVEVRFSDYEALNYRPIAIQRNRTTAERRVRQMEQEQRRQKQEAEKKLKAIQHRMEGYEDEVIRVIDGTSKFSDEMLARLIARTEAELQQEKQNYEELCRGLQTKETVSDIRTYYRDFLGWANEFDCASLPRKRAILSQLLDSVEVGRGYKIIIHMNVNYEQFLHPDTQEEYWSADVCAGG